MLSLIFFSLLIFASQDLLNNEAMPDEVLECLIKHKTHSDMDEKCAVGIEHHQIVSFEIFLWVHWVPLLFL